MDFPWQLSSQGLKFDQNGKCPTDFPPGCQARLFFLEFNYAQRLTPSHHEYLELSYVYDGSGRFVVENKSYDIHPGDVINIGDHEFHLLYANKDQTARTITLHFLPEVVYAPGQNPGDFDYLKPFYLRGSDFTHVVPASAMPREFFPDRLTKMYLEMQQGGAIYPLAVRTYLRDLLLEICRFHTRRGGEFALPSRRASEFERLRTVFDYIAARYAEKIGLAKVADLANMSPTSFCRFFKSVTGSAFSDYLLRFRIDRATDLLLSTDRPVYDVALQVGFNSHSYFDRTYKSITGLTPLETRHQRKR